MILKNAKIVLEDKTIQNGWIEIDNNLIKSINEGSTDKDGMDLDGNTILPGFIDCHVHGGYGVGFETGTVEGYFEFAKNISKEGVTKYCQGSVTNSQEDNRKFFTAFKEFMETQNEYDYSKCIGCYMEGPFISPQRKGAHEVELLKKPDIDHFKELQTLSGNNIRYVTYAPELQDGSFTKYLTDNKIIPTMGHSEVTAKEAIRDFELGAKHVTHLFNAMSGVNHQVPGLATYALNNDNILAEVISDGIHVQPEVLELIYKTKGPDEICIITDAMSAKGMPDGEYKLGNLPVIKEGMKVSLKSNGALAGAGATYDHNVRTYLNTIKEMKLTDLVKMTSINVAKELNIFDKTGSIAINKLADLTVLDKELNVILTISEGKVAFKK